MSKPKAPPAPDYAGLAQQQGTENRDSAYFNTTLNRANQYTPYGSLTWETRAGANPNDPQAGDWTQRMTLAPEQQRLLDSQNRVSQNLADTAEAGLNRVGAAMATPFDMSRFGDPQVQANDESRRRVEEAMMSRLQPQFDRDNQALRTRLAQSGITVGSQAYNDEMARADRGLTDARMQAVLAGGQEESRQTQLSQMLRQAGIQEQAWMRQLPLNELNALRTGAQVQGPKFDNYYTGGNAAAAPVMDAGIAQGNYDMAMAQQQQGGWNALLGGLGQMGAAYLGKSDRRLKTNITAIGQHRSGVSLYTWDWVDGSGAGLGVMADELAQVRPDAVSVAADGFQRVNYSAIGGLL